jgi:hypothetical protein
VHDLGVVAARSSVDGVRRRDQARAAQPGRKRERQEPDDLSTLQRDEIAHVVTEDALDCAPPLDLVEERRAGRAREPSLDGEVVVGPQRTDLDSGGDHRARRDRRFASRG